MYLKSLLLLSVIITTSTAATTRSGKSYNLRADRPTEAPNSTSDSRLNSPLTTTLPPKVPTMSVIRLEEGAATTRSGKTHNLRADRPTEAPNSTSDSRLNSPLTTTLPPLVPTMSVIRLEEGGVPQRSKNVPGEPKESCECVPFYQCSKNRTIIENGEGIIDIRMNEGSCDYLEVCCRLADTLSSGERITPTPSTRSSSNTCGRRNFNGVSGLRILGAVDNEVQFGEFPWMVAITKEVEVSPGKTETLLKCGGSLIHPKVVLTAAHCVEKLTGLKVRAGEWDTQRETEPLPTQTRAVSEIIIHEDYNKEALMSDIALLILEAPVDLAENVATVCLPQQGENMDNRLCVASGWGKDVFGKKGKNQVILKKVELPIVPKGSCQETLRKTELGRYFLLHHTFMCAGGEIGKDTCTGDGGGPLACPDRGDPSTYVQAGIISWGIGCGSAVPGVYTDVANFRNWIDTKLSQLNHHSRSDSLRSLPVLQES